MILQHTLHYCNTLYSTATYVWRHQHAAGEGAHHSPSYSHCNICSVTATNSPPLQHTLWHCNTFCDTATHSTLLQHTFHRNTLCDATTHPTLLQHILCHCKTLLTTSTRCRRRGTAVSLCVTAPDCVLLQHSHPHVVNATYTLLLQHTFDNTNTLPAKVCSGQSLCYCNRFCVTATYFWQHQHAVGEGAQQSVSLLLQQIQCYCNILLRTPTLCQRRCAAIKLFVTATDSVLLQHTLDNANTLPAKVRSSHAHPQVAAATGCLFDFSCCFFNRSLQLALRVVCMTRYTLLCVCVRERVYVRVRACLCVCCVWMVCLCVSLCVSVFHLCLSLSLSIHPHLSMHMGWLRLVGSLKL